MAQNELSIEKTNVVTTSQKSYLDFNLSDLRGELSEVPESSGHIPNPDGIYPNKVKSWTLGGRNPKCGIEIGDPNIRQQKIH